MTRVAAVDCGTNSIRLLVADVDPAAGTLVDVDRRMEIVRLGQGVDRTGQLAPEAIERTRVALAAYASQIRDLGAGRPGDVALGHEVVGVRPGLAEHRPESRAAARLAGEGRPA